MPRWRSVPDRCNPSIVGFCRCLWRDQGEQQSSRWDFKPMSQTIWLNICFYWPNVTYQHDHNRCPVRNAGYIVAVQICNTSERVGRPQTQTTLTNHFSESSFFQSSVIIACILVNVIINMIKVEFIVSHFAIYIYGLIHIET